MIILTKRNNEQFVVNHRQISCIETIPETKVVLMNRDYYIVLETPEEVVEKIIDFTAKVKDVYRVISIVDHR
ncbi:MAG: flagellar FlbD family protein [Eubacteriales bacterium]